MTAPKRIQRQRTLGWRMPAGAAYVGRPTRWGNPFRVGDGFDAPFVWDLPSYDEALNHDNIVTVSPALAVDLFRQRGPRHDIHELRGKDLACWCPLVDADGHPVPCHADVLLEWANAPLAEGADAGDGQVPGGRP